MRADTIYYNAQIFNTPYKKFFTGYFSVKNGKFLHLGVGDLPLDLEYNNSVDLGGKYVIPGLIDSHMHIESSMLTPKPFAKILAKNGVTTIISEPHEIANVTGVGGVVAMINAGKGADIDIFYAIPSSVPSTSAEFETTGADIDLPELKQLLNYPEVICLGEVMNTYKILTDPEDKQNQFIRYLKEKNPLMPLEGHCPRIIGHQLNQYVYTGIGSDHTEHDLEAFKQRIFNGMIFQIQHKMVKPEIINEIVSNNLYENISIVTDDVTPSNLINHGHLNHVVQQCIDEGMPAEYAVYCASATPARRMRLFDRGQIMPGMLADFCVLDDKNTIMPSQTFKSGNKIFDTANLEQEFLPLKEFPEEFYSTIKTSKITENTFDFSVSEEKQSVKLNGLSVDKNNTKTSFVQEVFQVEDGQVKLDDKHNKLFVIERYGKNNNIGKCIAAGDCVVNGAVASSYAHDHHNLIVLGSNNADMTLAANTVSDLGGGIVVVSNGKVIAKCQLEICGLMSERNPYIVAKDIENVEKSMREIGYTHYNPVMSLATTCLPVSMDVKITDIGLIDVQNGKVLPFIEE